MTLLKNVLVWDGPPLRSTGVPNLFGSSPLRCQFTDEKAPNKLGIPTGGSFFNRIFDTLLRYRYKAAQPALAKRRFGILEEKENVYYG
jgi:hypothetical protein